MNQQKKIFIIDIDAAEFISKVKLGLYDGLPELVQNISEKNDIILTSIRALNYVKDVASFLKLKKGVLVSNNGSIAYDISSDSIIFESVIEQNKVKAIAHVGTINNGLIIANSESAISAYAISPLVLNNAPITSGAFCDVLSDFSQFLNNIKDAKVHNIEIWWSTAAVSSSEKYEQRIKKIESVSQLQNVSFTKYDNYRVIFNNFGVSKKNTIDYILKNVDQVYASKIYITINEFTHDLKKLSNTSIISSKISSKYGERGSFTYDNVDNSLVSWLEDNNYIWE